MNQVPRPVGEFLGVYLAAVPTLSAGMRSWQDGRRRPLSVNGVFSGAALTVALVLVAALMVRRLLAHRGGGGQPRPPGPSRRLRPVTVAYCRGGGQRRLFARRVGFDLDDFDQDRPPQWQSTDPLNERRWQ